MEVGHVTPANEWAVDVGLAARLSVTTRGYLALRGMKPPTPYLAPQLAALISCSRAVGQLEPEARAAVRSVLDADASRVGIDDALAGGQADPEPVHAGQLDALAADLEPEDRLPLRHRHARPVVGDGEAGPALEVSSLDRFSSASVMRSCTPTNFDALNLESERIRV